MIAESVTGDHGGGLRSHRFVRSYRQRHARLHFDGHGAATLERHARKPTQTDRAVALAAGSAGEVARTLPVGQLHRMQHIAPVFLPLECCESVRSHRSRRLLYCGCFVVPSVVRKSLSIVHFQYFHVVIFIIINL